MANSTPGPQSNPFLDPEDERDPVRRLRGRLTAPVTIVTAGGEAARSGLTVSSLFVAEGEPPLAYLLLGAVSDLYDTIERTGRFVIHVCEIDHREAADAFAGMRPSPGGVFADRSVEQSDYGPVLDGFATKAFCSYRGGVEESYSVLVSASIDRIEVSDLDHPLAYFRGRYRGLA